jgi:chemotaxis-related protein WspB
MLFLLFHLGDQQFALDASAVVEVVPTVELRPVHDAPGYMAGLFDYRGTVVPVVDLCLLTLGRPASLRLSTRIIMVQHCGRDGSERLLGLLTEGVTEAVQRKEAELRTSEVLLDVQLELGEIATSGEGMLQCLRLDRVLPADIETVLDAEALDQGDVPALD